MTHAPLTHTQAEYVLAMNEIGIYAHLPQAQALASMERDFRNADHDKNGSLEARACAPGRACADACSTAR
jgi:hypothetical protein